MQQTPVSAVLTVFPDLLRHIQTLPSPTPSSPSSSLLLLFSCLLPNLFLHVPPKAGA
jgi:hypothetical protein